MEGSSPARLYAALVGGTLVVAGVLGFLYNGHFGSGSDVYGDDRSVEVFGVLAVNGWHNVVHIATGALGLLAVGSRARTYALALGLAYLVIAAWGFILGSPDAILDFLPVNTADNFLHLAFGVVGLAAGAATPAVERASG